MYEPSTYEVLAAKLLAMYQGEVHRKALELMEELRRLGLAARTSLYDSKGVYITDAYRVPPELAHTILEHARSPLPREAYTSSQPRYSTKR